MRAGPSVQRFARFMRAALAAIAVAIAPVAWSADAAPPAAASVTDRSEAARLHALLDESWARAKRDFPEFATFLGDERYNDRLADMSAAAIEERKAYRRDVLARLSKIDVRRLAGQDVV